ncbi:hypothetical protein P171DRAFT_486333 [Karstenula rhodostoma CBS 690.94]|uniref:Uncharacterized protein n=1 Tax=Karstenula rhodostoma CBS 690.94 TaxID=1392251 RepID=A0A9P4PHU3_9PLEO|nr:hypothetical protein P171DRAFT_486333 [Karstenula rhodostoma CBS 690.94]
MLPPPRMLPGTYLRISVTKTVDSKTTGKTVDVAGPSGSSTDLKATAPGFGVLRGNKNATTSGVKPIKATSSTAISDQKRSRRARASHPQRRNFNKFRPTQPIERGAHTERATLGGWGDVLTTVRKDDIAIRAANEAKAEATKHLEPGEWTTKFAPRATKTS